jgi:hypothetical protein
MTMGSDAANILFETTVWLVAVMDSKMSLGLQLASLTPIFFPFLPSPD